MIKVMKTAKRLICIGIATAMVSLVVLPAADTSAAIRDYDNGIRFDADYYASAYPELVALIGKDETNLLNHYLLIGIGEGRTAYENQSAEEIENLKSAFLQMNSAEPEAVTEPEAVAVPETVAEPEAAEEPVVVEEPVAATVPPIPEVPVEVGIPAPVEQQKSNGLVLVYLNGTDLESIGQSATQNLNGMIEASATGNTRFVILAGGTRKWAHPALQSANNGAIVSYVVENGTIRELDHYEEGNKGSNYLTPEMISTFIRDTTEKYSADHTSMVFWDHGGGAAGGYGSNELGEGGSMSAADVAAGIRQSGAKFESVGFDTCLMGSLEVASNFVDVAKYYVASQEFESSHGWDFRTFANYGTGDFTDFGKQLIDDYDKWNQEKKEDRTRTLSMLDLGKVPKAQQQWNDFLTTYGSNSVGIQQMLAARARAREFCYGEAADARAEGVDLGDFISQFGSPQAKALKESLEEVVLYKNANTMEGVNGLSVFIPGENVYTYNQNYNNIAANNLSETAMKTFDKMSSVYAGQKSSILFGETWSDEKHIGEGNSYENEAWYDKEYAELGSQDRYSYKQVVNGGFSVESDLGLTAAQLQESELRVMFKTDDGYINLGRIENFCRTKDTKSPVFNYNGQWLHINGMPVMLYQYGEFDSVENNHHYKDFYTMAMVNGEVKKVGIQWDGTAKTWNTYGYIDPTASFDSRTTETPFADGDRVQFLYDAVTSDGKPVSPGGVTAIYDEFTFDYDTLDIRTKEIETGEGVDLLFHGTVTDAYGKTYTTPYFKMEKGSDVITTEEVDGQDFVIEKSDSLQKEDWEITDSDSFLTYSYDDETNSYSSYDEFTNAYNVILADTGEFRHYNENRKCGFGYDPNKDTFYIVDESGDITGKEYTAEELAKDAAKTGRDYSDFYALLHYIAALTEDRGFEDSDYDLLEQAQLYDELDHFLDNIAGGYVDGQDVDEYELYQELLEQGDFDEYPDYDENTWESDSGDPSDDDDYADDVPDDGGESLG